MPQTILHLDSAITGDHSVTRKLTADIVARISGADTKVIYRDLAKGVPSIDNAWLNAVRQAPEHPTPDQQALIDISNSYVDDIRSADTLVIALPVYNFSVPAQLKNWLDQIARAGVTFSYTADGPQGLMTGKKAIVAMASGGTRAESAADFAWPYLRQMLGFIGITDVTLVAADGMALDADASRNAAQTAISALAA